MTTQPPYATRSDSVDVKLALLQRAYRDNNRDLAMSLLESMKDTLQYEKQRSLPVAPPVSGAQEAVSVQDLPAAWSDWAHGWSWCKPLELQETAGLARRGEPINIPVAFAAAQTTDLRREVRVASVDADGCLRQVVSQVYDEVFERDERHCRLVFTADVDAGANATYLVFYGNELAQLPGYTTDLHVDGEGWGLDIENDHYVANLSRQMGQMERLTYKRDHGLTLFAGGEGHGEPPNIDWAHDYVPSGRLHKVRVTNWAQCPNYEVVRGPLCVQVRRWGFPHSPGHPLYTPSRMHVDVTYTFYAGLPYFFKNGRMDFLADGQYTVRDDEWVFSGYSFNGTVWMDREGTLHEGDIPEQQQQDLQGVGFFHRGSKDAFIALRLVHEAQNYDNLVSTGRPFDYDGHGQVWARYPAGDPNVQAGASMTQESAYLVAPYEGPGAVQQVREQLMSPLQVTGVGAPATAVSQNPGRLARLGEIDAEGGPLKRAIWEAMRETKDAMFYENDANVVDMGYIYDVRLEEDVAHVTLTMPHKGRPKHGFLHRPGPTAHTPLCNRLREIDGVRDVVIHFTWEPAWTAARVSAQGRANMGLEEVE
jgi:metal-sulfur cluster biosynthetic enzyme